tara:strand:+ start:1797 stop:2042 length:246 start_codon:yes stop_codon:yes gene_type:complete
MKSSPIKLKQKLSPKASAAKKIRDKKAAMSEDGKYKKRTAQVERRKKSSAFLKGKDYDHRTSSFKSVKYNRGGGGNGTKNE